MWGYALIMKINENAVAWGKVVTLAGVYNLKMIRFQKDGKKTHYRGT